MSRCPNCDEVQKAFERDNQTSEYHFTCPNGHEWAEPVVAGED